MKNDYTTVYEYCKNELDIICSQFKEQLQGLKLLCIRKGFLQMNILRRSLLNKKINRWYKQLSGGEFNEFFIKAISKSKKILIIGKPGTGAKHWGSLS